MTVTDNGARDTRDTPLVDLSDADAAIMARADWQESAGTLTGAELAKRYGRSPRWGQKQAAAARAAATNGTVLSPTAARAERAPAARPVPKRTPAPARPAARGTRRDRSQVVLLALAVAAFGTVGLVCGVVSYFHIRHLAELAGMGGLAGWVPLGVDGLVVACSCSLIMDRRRRVPAHGLARAGAALGLVGSVAANVLAVDPTLVPIRAVSVVLAGYPPLALAVAGHLLLRMLEDR